MSIPVPGSMKKINADVKFAQAVAKASTDYAADLTLVAAPVVPPATVNVYGGEVGHGTDSSSAPTGPFVVPGARPFATTSPWNTLIPTGTVWYNHVRLHTMPDSTSQHWYLNFGFKPVYAASTDPTWTVTLSDYIADSFNRHRTATSFSILAPAGLVSGAGTDNVICVIQPDGAYTEVWQTIINNGAKTITGYSYSGWARDNILTGPGVGGLVASGGNNAGVRAANYSWAAGLITTSDLAAGVIDHALVCALPQAMLKDSANAFRSPATAWDNASGGYGPFDNGTRFGVPTGVAAPAGLSTYGTYVFNAMQRYGCYVGDYTGGPHAGIYVHTDVPNDSGIWPLYAYWDYGGMADLDKIFAVARIANYQP